MDKKRQTIAVFQQDGSGEGKIRGIRQFGDGLYTLEVHAIDGPLPAVIDDSEAYLPDEVHADLVLDFLRHPDLSYDLARLCSRSNIPVVASGKKHRVEGVITPPT